MMLCIVNRMNDFLWNSLYCMYMAFTVLYVYGTHCTVCIWLCTQHICWTRFHLVSYYGILFLSWI